MKYKVKVEHKATKEHVFSIDAEDTVEATEMAEERAGSFDWDGKEDELDSYNDAWDIEEDNG